MAVTARKLAPPQGHSKPRIAPPTPARSDVKALIEVAAELGIDFMPWQETAGRYVEALAADGRHLYREVGAVVSRQNGKTELLVPLIVKWLRAGLRIMHTAQDRSLPREVFYRVAEVMWSTQSELFPMRNGRPTKPRYANGQEEIRLTNGGIYSIVAPTRGGARGPTRDRVIIDELREMDSWDFISAAKPTMTVSKDPQILYLSNAGQDDSIVLNALRNRASSDPQLAYLEWSAAPERAADDPVGWAEANPAMGNERGEMGSVLEYLTGEHRTATLEGTLSKFEVEHLCRWVASMRERLVDPAAWALCKGEPEKPRRSWIATSMDPRGSRASVAEAWLFGDGMVGLRMLENVVGDPIDTDELGKRVKALSVGKKGLGGDSTDAELLKYVPKPKPRTIIGKEYAAASAQFANLVAAGKIRWVDCDAVTDDLTWTSRTKADENGSYHAVRALDDRPITASLAAIRAVWLASGPTPAAPRVM